MTSELRCFFAKPRSDGHLRRLTSTVPVSVPVSERSVMPIVMRHFQGSTLEQDADTRRLIQQLLVGE